MKQYKCFHNNMAALLLGLIICWASITSCTGLGDPDSSRYLNNGYQRDYVYTPEIYKRHTGIYDGQIMTGHGDSAFVVVDTVCPCKIELGNAAVKTLSVHEIPIRLFMEAIDDKEFKMTEEPKNNNFSININTEYYLVAYYFYPTEKVDKKFNGVIELRATNNPKDSILIEKQKSGYNGNLVVSYKSGYGVVEGDPNAQMVYLDYDDIGWDGDQRLSDGMFINIVSIKNEATGKELKLKENHKDIFIRIPFPKENYKPTKPM